MSFENIANKYQRDPNFLERTFELNLLLRVVAPEINGGIYDIPRGTGGVLYPFDKEFIGKEFLPLNKRRPNVPEGTNTLRQAIMRQAMMVFGADRFPIIETKNEKAREVLNAFIEEAEIEDRMRQAVVLGSPGSVAMHIRVLAEPGGPSRIYVENYPTGWLTPIFNPYRPDTLNKIVEKYKTTGRALANNGYDIPEEHYASQFWFMREWDLNSEIWYIPWTQKEETQIINFTPQIDITRTVDHNLGFCPWLWIKNLPLGNGIDGSCQFQEALNHAINLDYLESQIAAAVKYTMSPTMVIQRGENGAGAPITPTKGEGAGFVKAPSTILTIDNKGKAYYLEISGEGIEQARKVAADLRKAIIEACHGDRLDVDKITQAHQGAKTIAMMNQPMLGLCDQLRSCYGSALKRLLKMVMAIIENRHGKNYPGVEVNGDIVDIPDMKANDLKLTWGVYYADTPAELYAEAQAIDSNLRNGLLSRERAMVNIAGTYNIADIKSEQALVAQDQAENDAREMTLAGAKAAVKVNANIPNG